MGWGLRRYYESEEGLSKTCLVEHLLQSLGNSLTLALALALTLVVLWAGTEALHESEEGLSKTCLVKHLLQSLGNSLTLALTLVVLWAGGLRELNEPKERYFCLLYT